MVRPSIFKLVATRAARACASKSGGSVTLQLGERRATCPYLSCSDLPGALGRRVLVPRDVGGAVTVRPVPLARRSWFVRVT